MTLPGVNAQGFLVHRSTFKLPILSALLKPKTRSTEPSFELNLDNPRGLISPSFKRFLSLFPYALRYILIYKFLVFLVVGARWLPRLCLSWFSPSTKYYYFLGSRFGIGYPFVLAGILPVLSFTIACYQSN